MPELPEVETVMRGLAPVMQGQATGLSDEDIANLAAYYASLPADGGK